MKNYYSILFCPHCHSINLSRKSSCFVCDDCNSVFNDYHGKILLIDETDKRNDYEKFLVTVNNNEFWRKEAFWDKRFKELLPDGQGFLLDYACGGGQRKWCESKGYQYIGLDYYLDYGVDIIANGMNIPIKDNSISVVTSASVMEHIPNPWLACKEIFRVLEPNGIYIGFTAFLQPFHERSYYNMSHLGVQLMLEQAGFKVELIEPTKISGIESILRTLIGLKSVYKFFIFPFLLFSYSLLITRKISAKILLFYYKNNKEKKDRINEFLNEEPLRFTAGFYYIAKKI